MGNRAFGSLVARSRPQTLARQQVPGQQTADPPPVSAAVRGVVNNALIPPLERIADELAEGPSEKPQLRSIRRRLAAAIGGFGAIRLPATATPGRRLSHAKANAEIALGLLDALIAPRPESNLRMAWGRTLGIVQAAATRAPRAGAGDEVDRRQLIRSTTQPAVLAAINDIPAVVNAETAEGLLEIRASHMPVLDQIHAGLEGDPQHNQALTQFMIGLEIIRMAAKPEEERAKMIGGFVERAIHDLTNLEVDPDTEDYPPSAADEPEEAEPDADPVAPTTPPATPIAPPGPNPLPPPPPPAP